MVTVMLPRAAAGEEDWEREREAPSMSERDGSGDAGEKINKGESVKRGRG